MNLSVYFVTPHNPDDSLVLAALKGGASVIQLRDKTASDAVLIAQARRLVAMAEDFNIPLIINDRVEVALASGASGLHMGQSDGDPVAVRAALGLDKILGLSIENEVQLATMAALPKGTLDYIGAGPVRATASKLNHATPIGFETLARIAKAAPVPCVGIGGVKQADIATVKAAGCAGLAIVSAISGAVDPELATRQLVASWEAA
ncbi:thiamine phosphate synthase [Cohaesibacter celericrescens]|uniref:Thiamine-phosphate synthase n=1 Tax=Cohaesibacter celericrescens TaxID=2067669 RepID=A0A2N5XNC8_9HYPH|nr:thiamine phosphate synthase [Cohaesibacter celericrescens]PLW75985.1 thiamine phosphate synthase [Cohaesibacter celericrescens]